MSHVFGMLSDNKFIKFNNETLVEQSPHGEMQYLAKYRNLRKLLKKNKEHERQRLAGGRCMPGTEPSDINFTDVVKDAALQETVLDDTTDSDSIGDPADLLERSSESDFFDDDYVDFDDINNSSGHDAEVAGDSVDVAIAKAIEKKNLQSIFRIIESNKRDAPVNAATEVVGNDNEKPSSSTLTSSKSKSSTSSVLTAHQSRKSVKRGPSKGSKPTEALESVSESSAPLRARGGGHSSSDEETQHSGGGIASETVTTASSVKSGPCCSAAVRKTKVKRRRNRVRLEASTQYSAPSSAQSLQISHEEEAPAADSDCHADAESSTSAESSKSIHARSRASSSCCTSSSDLAAPKESSSSLGNDYDRVSSYLSIKDKNIKESAVMQRTCHVHARAKIEKRSSFIALIAADSENPESITLKPLNVGKCTISHIDEQRQLVEKPPAEEEMDYVEALRTENRNAQMLECAPPHAQPCCAELPIEELPKPKRKPYIVNLKQLRAKLLSGRTKKELAMQRANTTVCKPEISDISVGSEVSKDRSPGTEVSKDSSPSTSIHSDVDEAAEKEGNQEKTEYFSDESDEEFQVQAVPANLAMMSQKLMTLELHAEQNSNFLRRLNDCIQALEKSPPASSETSELSHEENDLQRLIDDTEVTFKELGNLRPDNGEFLYVVGDEDKQKDRSVKSRYVHENITLECPLHPAERKENVPRKMKSFVRQIQGSGDGAVVQHTFGSQPIVHWRNPAMTSSSSTITSCKM